MWISSPLKALRIPWSSTSGSLLHHCFSPWITSTYKVDAHRFIKVHVVGEDFDIRVEDPRLANYLFQNVSYASREDEQWDIVLVQMVKEELEAIPIKTMAL